jgi:hypothetical protein
MPLSNQENQSVEKNREIDPKRQETAKVVSNWLAKKSDDDKKIPSSPYTLGQMAQSIGIGLANQEIYFIVTEDPNAPAITNRKTRVEFPAIESEKGKLVPFGYAIGLQVKSGTTVEELITAGDSVLVKLFSDHMNTTLDNGRVIPAIKEMKIKDSTFGPFPVK